MDDLDLRRVGSEVAHSLVLRELRDGDERARPFEGPGIEAPLVGARPRAVAVHEGGVVDRGDEAPPRCEQGPGDVEIVVEVGLPSPDEHVLEQEPARAGIHSAAFPGHDVDGDRPRADGLRAGGGRQQRELELRVVRDELIERLRQPGRVARNSRVAAGDEPDEAHATWRVEVLAHGVITPSSPGPEG